MLTAKKGISCRQIRSMFFGDKSSLHTAWYVGHRLRAGLQDDGFKKLMGIVEVDETYIGGKDKTAIGSRSPASNGKLKGSNEYGGKIGYGKDGAIGAIEHKGNVVCWIIGQADARALAGFARHAVNNVNKKYLPLYLNEFQCRQNNRHNPDLFGTAKAGRLSVRTGERSCIIPLMAPKRITFVGK
jgi:transposase-like protein